MRRLLVGVAAAAALAASCAGPHVPPVTPQQAQAAQAHWPGMTVAELDRGRSLYLGRCSSCHDLVPPERYSAVEWPGYVAKMKERAHLSDADARAVEAFLGSASGR
jgi:mono/diheme cytochrome c family protein